MGRQLAGHLEPLAAVIRIGGHYGEAWTWAAIIRYLSPVEVEVMAVMRAPKPSEWRAMKEILLASGVRIGHFARRTSQGVRRHTWTKDGRQ